MKIFKVRFLNYFIFGLGGFIVLRKGFHRVESQTEMRGGSSS